MSKSYLNINTLLLLTLAVIFTLPSCSNSDSAAKRDARERIQQSVGDRSDNLLNLETQAQVYHYTCPNGHDEGSNIEGESCSICGAQFAHNQAYHDQQSMVANTNPTTGLYHYTCPNGHDQGGEDPNGTCPECGEKFIHNDAFHNQQQQQVEQPQIDFSTNTSNSSGLYHYTCPNGHDQGGEDPNGTCPECGEKFIHNDAFHNQQQPLQIEQPQMNIQTTPNTSGVYHYTCPNGHDHGADTQGGTCPICSAKYVHNDAYHGNSNF